MQLSHTFDLPAPVDHAFDVFSRLDLLAPCFPGATVWGRDGEVYHGAVKIKFGPFPLVFEGTARVVRTDVTERRLVVTAHARDRRGAAAGAATVTADFGPAGPGGTRIAVATDLDLTGRPAQLGSGAVQSVSDRLLEQFAGCLSSRLAAGLTLDQPVPDRPAGSAEEAAPEPSPPSYAYQPPRQPESVPHLQVLPDVARLWLPWAAGAAAGVLLVLVVRWLQRR